MTFPASYRAIEEMIENRALQTKTARSVVRKGGLPRREIPGVTTQAPRTIIDAFIDPPDVALARQYRANLSATSRVRLSSQSTDTVYVLYSITVEDSTLDPGDWQPLSDTSGTPVSSSIANSDPGDPLRWFTLGTESRTEVRLLVSTSQASPLLDSTTPFSVALQAD